MLIGLVKLERLLITSVGENVGKQALPLSMEMLVKALECNFLVSIKIRVRIHFGTSITLVEIHV